MRENTTILVGENYQKNKCKECHKMSNIKNKNILCKTKIISRMKMVDRELKKCGVNNKK